MRDLIYRETARRIIDSPRSKEQMLNVLRCTPSVQPKIMFDDLRAYCKKRNLIVITDEMYKAMINQSSVTQPTAEQIQKMQDIEQAQLEKAFELGREDAKAEIIRCRDCKYYCHEDYGLPYCNRRTTGFYAIDLDDFCSRAERKENQ